MKNELIKRISSSIILIPIALFFIIKGSFLFNFFITICFLITVYEWHNMSKNKTYNIFGHIFLLFSFYSVYFVRNKTEEESLFLFLLILLICISTDVGGYAFGKIFKGPKLTKISPKKTYSGMVGGFIFPLLFLLIYFFINFINMYFY